MSTATEPVANAVSPVGAVHLATMTGAVTALMWPSDPPHDVRIQNWVRANRSRRFGFNV